MQCSCLAEGTIVSKKRSDAANNKMYYAMLNYHPRFLDLRVRTYTHTHTYTDIILLHAQLDVALM